MIHCKNQLSKADIMVLWPHHSLLSQNIEHIWETTSFIDSRHKLFQTIQSDLVNWFNLLTE